MMKCYVRLAFFGLAGVFAVAAPVAAGQPKLDKDTCTQLHTEQSTFVQSGILADLQRGAEWGKTNLSADRLREIEHYIMLDEQIKFACREATLTPDMMRAGEMAKRLELNPDFDSAPPLPETSGDSDGAAATDAPAGLAPAPVAKSKAHKHKPAAGAAAAAKPDGVAVTPAPAPPSAAP